MNKDPIMSFEQWFPDGEIVNITKKHYDSWLEHHLHTKLSRL